MVLAAALSACTTYERPPAVAERAGPATPIRVYMLLERAEPRTGQHRAGYWIWAGQFAAALEEAGFEPVIVRARSEIPPDAAFVDGFRRDSLPCSYSGYRDLTVLTGGVIPTAGCDSFGYVFDVHRSSNSPPRLIDTRWKVDWIIGWLALPLGLPKGYSVRLIGMPHDSMKGRESPALRAAVLEALSPP